MENEIENLMLAIKNNELLMEYLKVDFQDKQLEVLALTSNSKYTNGSIKVKLGTVVPLEFDPSFERGKTDIRAEKNNHLCGIILKKLNYYN